MYVTYFDKYKINLYLSNFYVTYFDKYKIKLIYKIKNIDEILDLKKSISED